VSATVLAIITSISATSGAMFPALATADIPLGASDTHNGATCTATSATVRTSGFHIGATVQAFVVSVSTVTHLG
jgi:hypothetical protein